MGGFYAGLLKLIIFLKEEQKFLYFIFYCDSVSHTSVDRRVPWSVFRPEGQVWPCKQRVVATSPTYTPGTYKLVSSMDKLVSSTPQWCQHVEKVSGPVNTSEQPNLSEVCFLALFLWL